MLYEFTREPALRGRLVTVEYAVWSSATAKARMTARGYSPSPADVAVRATSGPRKGETVWCEGANNHKIQLAGGHRIASVGSGAAQRWLLTDGTQVDLLGAIAWPPTERARLERQIAAVGWATEAVAVDITATTVAHVDAWIARETSRAAAGRKDQFGRSFGRRDARGTTLNLVVATDADMAWWQTPSGAYNTTTGYVGYHAGNANHVVQRFIGSIPAGATCDSATFRQYVSAVTGSPQSRTYCEAATAPTMPTTAADAAARPLTTASALTTSFPASGWVSIDAKTAVHEALALGAITAINVHHKDAGGVHGNYLTIGMRAINAAYAPTLDIDYTVAPPGGRVCGGNPFGLGMRVGC